MIINLLGLRKRQFFSKAANMLTDAAYPSVFLDEITGRAAAKWRVVKLPLFIDRIIQWKKVRKL